MDLPKMFMSIILTPLLLISLFIVLPPYLVHKFIQSISSKFSEEDLTGKVIVITGASSGIGENVAYEYAKRGARLVLVARRKKLLEEVAGKARVIGSPEVIIVVADVSICEDCERFVKETINHFGRLDHLVNNAGLWSLGKFEDTKNIKNLRPLMDINIWGSIYLTHFAIPHLTKTKGKIIVNASVAGLLPTPISLYGATKAALINFYESLRVELGSKINIILVFPSYTETKMTRGKHLGYSGKMELDPAEADCAIMNIPMRTAKECAVNIVKGACRGKKYVYDAMFWQVLALWVQLAPDINQASSRLVFPSNSAPKAGTNVSSTKKIE